MAETRQILFQFGQSIAREIKLRSEQKGLTASGKTANSLQVNATNRRLTVSAEDYIYNAFEYGRGPGKFPPIKPIYDWLQFKKYGISWSTDAERKSIAFAIAKKIAREGTFLNRTQKGTGVINDVITRERIEAFLGTFGRTAMDELREMIIGRVA